LEERAVLERRRRELVEYNRVVRVPNLSDSVTDFYIRIVPGTIETAVGVHEERDDVQR
jgi:hypothetical protein